MRDETTGSAGKREDVERERKERMREQEKEMIPDSVLLLGSQSGFRGYDDEERGEESMRSRSRE